MSQAHNLSCKASVYSNDLCKLTTMNNLLSVKHPLNSLVGGGNLLRHRQTTHEVSKYCCGDCGKNLNRKDNLQSYTLAVHKESNEFRCNCGF